MVLDFMIRGCSLTSLTLYANLAPKESDGCPGDSSEGAHEPVSHVHMEEDGQTDGLELSAVEELGLQGIELTDAEIPNDDLKPRCLEDDTRLQGVRTNDDQHGVFHCGFLAIYGSEDLDLELARLKSFASSGSSAICVEHDGATQAETTIS